MEDCLFWVDQLVIFSPFAQIKYKDISTKWKTVFFMRHIIAAFPACKKLKSIEITNWFNVVS